MVGLERNITESVLDNLGQQLVKAGFSTRADREDAVKLVERMLHADPGERPDAAAVLQELKDIAGRSTIRCLTCNITSCHMTK